VSVWDAFVDVAPFRSETATPTNNPYAEVVYEPRMGDYPSAPYATQHVTDRSSLNVNEGSGNLYLTTRLAS
jgi:hypothetical protein